MNPTQNLNILLTLKDEATKQLQNFQGVLKDNEKTFRTMRNTGAMAFGAITAVAGVSVKAAADAEVAWTKFDVVFGDSADDMRQFVRDVRKDIPLAERVIGKMTAGLGDMLVPMGFARSEAAEMSKQFVSVSAGVAAFNNVDPSEVLNAIQSGLTGNSMALRRFGINADVARLEMLAMEMGLLDAGQSFNQLDSEQRRYIQAQALVEAVTRDSADAVAGLEKEKETLAFKMRDAGAAIQELREDIGVAFIPIVTDMFNAIRPVIESFRDWSQENPELIKWITLAALAISGLVFVLGTLGLILPKVLIGFTILSGPIGIIIAIIGLLILTVHNVIKIFNLLKNDLHLVWEGIKAIFKDAVDWIIKNTIDRLVNSIQRVIDMARRAGDAVRNMGSGAVSRVRDAGSNLLNRARSAIGVNDAIISPKGDIITTHPDDYLIATKNPRSLGGGGGLVINIGTMIGEEEYARRMGDQIMKGVGFNTSF